ncbi:hypothetical protein N4P55_12475 [Pseudomonas fluorescens]|uniref:hypothetical protein n=1 Tax=Pseudomonas fluorescens TaxID=294 RepID=UPI0021D3B582|nr:hypothetical protein [Pseudomonas fluorescens]UXV22129.1 hypothetical protein N4P55_12475 [Pseudomonas fluorescens]
MKIDVGQVIVADLKILKILYFSSGALEPFTIFRRSKFGMKLFFERYSNLLKSSFIYELDGVSRLTPTGRALIKSNLPRLSSVTKKWREVPSRFIGPKLPGGHFYVPNLELLSNKAFQI